MTFEMASIAFAACSNITSNCSGRKSAYLQVGQKITWVPAVHPSECPYKPSLNSRQVNLIFSENDFGNLCKVPEERVLTAPADSVCPAWSTAGPKNTVLSLSQTQPWSTWRQCWGTTTVWAETGRHVGQVASLLLDVVGKDLRGTLWLANFILSSW